MKNCPFCGGNNLSRSVDGGCLPIFLNEDQQTYIRENTPYTVCCSLSCDNCGAMIEDYAASSSPDEYLYIAAIENCYKKWNRRSKE